MCDKGTVMPRRGGECVVLWAVAEPMPWRRGSWMMSSRVKQWDEQQGQPMGNKGRIRRILPAPQVGSSGYTPSPLSRQFRVSGSSGRTPGRAVRDGVTQRSASGAPESTCYSIHAPWARELKGAPEPPSSSSLMQRGQRYSPALARPSLLPSRRAGGGWSAQPAGGATWSARPCWMSRRRWRRAARGGRRCCGPGGHWLPAETCRDLGMGIRRGEAGVRNVNSVETS